MTAPVLLAAVEPVVTLTPQADRVRIEINGSWFSDYIFSGAPKPYLYPILAADGTRLNRDFPMAEVEGESRDHLHHRSLWFGHGRVNGEDFWLENGRSGIIEQDALLEAASGPVGVLRPRDRWVAKSGAVVCTEDRTLRIQPAGGGRLLDFEVTIHADHGPVVFEDTKEGTMSIRVAQWMNAATRVERESVPGPGHIINAGDFTIPPEKAPPFATGSISTTVTPIPPGSPSTTAPTPKPRPPREYIQPPHLS